MDYIEFAESKLNLLNSIQNKFIQEFKADKYDKWFYDSEIELLRLYNDESDEIFFKYIPVGTFSLNSNTWMWSWFNESSVEKSKFETLKIQEIGIEKNYEKLKSGTFSSDEYDCWDFVAIAFSILNGVGVYKVKSDHLEKFMILTEVFNGVDKIHKVKQKTVDCGTHGFGRPAFVCQHLNYETKKGFQEAFETFKGMDLEEDDDFQAWCDKCEKIRIKSDGWNDESMEFAKIKVICEDCYFELKKINQ